MPEGMKSNKSPNPELVFHPIDEWVMAAHLAEQLRHEKNGKILTWILDPTAHKLEILDSPVTRELRMISSGCTTGNELIYSIEESLEVGMATIRHSRNWGLIRSMAWDKVKMLEFIEGSFLQDVEKSQNDHKYQQDGFKETYFQILMCIQDFYQKLPD